jgi:hypothetical protein
MFSKERWMRARRFFLTFDSVKGRIYVYLWRKYKQESVWVISLISLLVVVRAIDLMRS